MHARVQHAYYTVHQGCPTRVLRPKFGQMTNLFWACRFEIIALNLGLQPIQILTTIEQTQNTVLTERFNCSERIIINFILEKKLKFVTCGLLQLKYCQFS